MDRQQLRRDAKSRLLNLRVVVLNGPDKGRIGEIRDASGHDDDFLVNLTLMTAEPPRRYPRKNLAIA